MYFVFSVLFRKYRIYMAIMLLEVLSNDLLLHLFEYLNEVDVFRGFHGLNYRFNSLIFTQRPIICLDFRSTSKRDFEITAEKHIPIIFDRVTSLCLSNDVDTPQQVEYFLGQYMPLHTFINLRSLSLYHIHSYKLLQSISEEWRLFPNLTHLNVIKCLASCDPRQCQQLVDSIWCLSKLICCHLGVNLWHGFHVPKLPVPSSSLVYLSLPYLYVDFDDLIRLATYTPRIRHLDISLNSRFIIRNQALAIPSILSLKLYVRDGLFAVRGLLQCVPNLRHLTVKSLDTYSGALRNCSTSRLNNDSISPDQFIYKSSPVYMNGHTWRDIILNSLPKLKTFTLKMKIRGWFHVNKEDEVDKLLGSFSDHS